MNDQNFTTSLIVDQSPEEVFNAINNVRDWWSGEIEGDTNKLGAEFTYQYKDMHRSTQKITEFVPGKKIVWHVLDSYLSFVEDKREWDGTEIMFELTKKGEKTKLCFTHAGLVPRIACYKNCAPAWSYYIDESLRSLITTGKGQPNPNEEKEKATL